MKAVIMAGGEGTRLRPLTCTIPKPMVPVAGKPVMQHIIELLTSHGINDIAATLQYLPDRITERFGDGAEFGANMRYFIEKTPLGTAGSVRNAMEFLDDTFVVISGDALTDIDLAEAAEFHRSRGAMATIILKSVDVPLEYGVVITAEDGRIVRFVEKPGWSEVFSDTVNTGIYILSPEIFDYIPDGRAVDFSKDVFPKLLSEGKDLFGFISGGYWCDIGDIGAYIQAQYDTVENVCTTNAASGLRDVGGGVLAGADTYIDKNAEIHGPCIIGPGSRVEAGALIDRDTVIGSGCFIGPNSRLKRCVLWDNVWVGSEARISGSIICDRVTVCDGAALYEQSTVGEGSRIGEHSELKPSVKIWPGKLTEEGSVVTSNLVWGSVYSRGLFGERGVRGAVNIDITPEFCAKLASAFVNAHSKAPLMTIGSDGTAAAEMLKSAFSSGMAASGARVADIGVVPLPVARTAVRFYAADGGAHIYEHEGQPGQVTIDLLNKNGFNIDRGTERKIESTYARGDGRRADAAEIRLPEKLTDFANFYKRAVVNRFKDTNAGFRVALNAPNPGIAAVISGVLGELGCSAEISDMKYIDSKTCHEGIGKLSAEMFASRVRGGRFDFGAAVSRDGENMLLADARGRLVSEDMFNALTAMILFRKNGGGATISAPVTATSLLEELASKHSGSVTRTKTLARDIMPALSHDQFLLHFDAAAGLAALVDFLSSNGMALHDLIDSLPEIHMIRKEISCTSGDKGKIMRTMSSESRSGPAQAAEGVKLFYDKGWVLILPDAARPVVNVIGESFTTEFAEELVGNAIEKITKSLEK